MSRPVCPACGSVSVKRGPSGFTCRKCAHTARRFPSTTDPVESAERWDGRERANGQVLKVKGAE